MYAVLLFCRICCTAANTDSALLALDVVQVGRFGITGSAQTLKIKHLSDGLKSRVVFAWLAQRTPHMLLLDEPTNHLDIETIDSLARAINSEDCIKAFGQHATPVVVLCCCLHATARTRSLRWASHTLGSSVFYYVVQSLYRQAQQGRFRCCCTAPVLQTGMEAWCL
jgi:hypothetical protein